VSAILEMISEIIAPPLSELVMMTAPCMYLLTADKNRVNLANNFKIKKSIFPATSC